MIEVSCLKCKKAYQIAIGGTATLCCQSCGSTKATLSAGYKEINIECIKCGNIQSQKIDEPFDTFHICNQKDQKRFYLFKLFVERDKQFNASAQPKIESLKSPEVITLEPSPEVITLEPSPEVKPSKMKGTKIALIGNPDQIEMNRRLNLFDNKLNDIFQDGTLIILSDLEIPIIGNRIIYKFSEIKNIVTTDRQEYLQKATKRQEFNSILANCDLIIGWDGFLGKNMLTLGIPVIKLTDYVSYLIYPEVKEKKGMSSLLKKTIVEVFSIPNLSYCIVTWNHLEKTKRCIKAIIDSKRNNDEIVVFDNGSNDGTVQWLKEQEGDKFRVFYSDVNKGCIFGRNQLIKEAKGRWIYFIDNDQVIAPETIINLFRKGGDIVGGECWYLDKSGIFHESQGQEKTSFIGAGGMLVKSDVIRDLGGFSDEFSPAFFEDPDFCYRAREKGYSVNFINDAGVLHNCHSGTQNVDGKVYLRNRKILLKKWSKKLGLKNPITKPTCAVIVDVPGWAWDIKTDQIIKYLGGDFQIDKVYLSKFHGNDLGYDCYFAYDVMVVNRHLDRIDSSRRMMGVCNHGYKHDLVRSSKYLKESVAIHANSKMLLEEVVGYNSKNYYLPNGVDEKLFSFQDRDLNDSFKVGYVGKDVVWKGLQDFIIPACKKANVELVMANGKYNDPKKIRHEDMVKFYKDVDVILIASTQDGTPNQLLEAASVGRTFIGNKIGNVPEFVKEGQNGFLVERDIEQYVERLLWLKKHRKECKEMGIQARKTVEQEWTWEIQVENYRKMFTDILGY